LWQYYIHAVLNGWWIYGMCLYVCMYLSIFPPGAANNWWIIARSSFAGMRAVLFEPTPRVEQNLALLHCGTLLKSERGLRETIINPALRTCFRNGKRQARDDICQEQIGACRVSANVLGVAGNRPGKNNILKGEEK
jgi:hypothetical protein